MKNVTSSRLFGLLCVFLLLDKSAARNATTSAHTGAPLPTHLHTPTAATSVNSNFETDRMPTTTPTEVTSNPTDMVTTTGPPLGAPTTVTSVHGTNGTNTNSNVTETPVATQQPTEAGKLRTTLTPRQVVTSQQPTRSTAIKPQITQQPPMSCTLKNSVLMESKLTATLQGPSCWYPPRQTCLPQPLDGQDTYNIPSGALLNFSCSWTDSALAGADLYGLDRAYCDDGLWQPANFPVCFDRCRINEQNLTSAGLNISGGQVAEGNTLRSGDSYTVNCSALDEIVWGHATIYCVDGEFVPSVLPVCRPDDEEVDKEQPSDTVSMVTFVAVVAPTGAAAALLFIALVAVWRKTPPRSEECSKERQNSKEVMIVNTTFASDRSPSTSIPPNVPERPSNSYFSSSGVSESYLTPTAKDPPTDGNGSIYDYIDPKSTDYYLELVA